MYAGSAYYSDGSTEAEDIGAPCCREYTQRSAAECEDK